LKYLLFTGALYLILIISGMADTKNHKTTTEEAGTFFTILTGATNDAIGATGRILFSGASAAVNVVVDQGPAAATFIGENLVAVAGATGGAIMTYGPPVASATCTVGLKILAVAAGTAAGALKGFSDAVNPE
jgi:hypothetical protein